MIESSDEILLWPKKNDVQRKIYAKINVFKRGLEKNDRNFSTTKLEIFKLRLCLLEALAQKKVMNKARARKICQTNFGKNYDSIVFEQNWIYMKKYFSSKKS